MGGAGTSTPLLVLLDELDELELELELELDEELVLEPPKLLEMPQPRPLLPLDPTTAIGVPPELLATSGGKAGGKAKVRVVTVLPGWRTTQAVRAIRRTLCRTLARGRWRTTDFTFACLTMAGRSGGFSATWTAPPPMIAPPQVQAQSFAKAILTDISRTLFQVAVTPG